MRVLFICCFVLLQQAGYSQRFIQGMVVDSSNRPLGKTYVFLNGTSVGTTTDEQGRFSMSLAPGRYTLVAAHSGFKTHHQLIDANDLPRSITLTLKAQPPQRDAAPERFRLTNWGKWGEFLLYELIGDSYSSDASAVKNTRTMHLYSTPDESELLVTASEPLIIQNRVLGYTVLYQLDSFYVNFKTQTLFQVGFTYFRSMDAAKAKEKQWQDNRRALYYGSLLHFMRSVYLNKITEEGFEVRRVTKVRNLAPTVIPDTPRSAVNTTPVMFTPSSENSKTGEYEDQVLNPDNYKDIIGLPLTGDSIAYGVSNTTAALDFNGFLLAVYKGKSAPGELVNGDVARTKSSQLLLLNSRPVEIESNGSYFDPADLLIIGDWLLPQPILMMLPFDYVPPFN